MAGFYVITTLILLFATFALAVGSRPVPCREDTSIETFLREAGIASKHARTYAGILQRNHIDENILPKLTIQQLQKLGITAYGDCMKIKQYFSGDTDECTQGNLCKNGGQCEDGFKCFSCICTREFLGPTCVKSCPCQNNGRCVDLVTGFRCECTPGYTGILCEKQWLNEDRFKQLEERIQELSIKLNRSEERLRTSERHFVEQNRILSEIRRKQNTSGWRLIRVDEDLNKLNKSQLHQTTPTYVQKMPLCLPRNTKAILICLHVFLEFRGSRLPRLEDLPAE